MSDMQTCHTCSIMLALSHLQHSVRPVTPAAQCQTCYTYSIVLDLLHLQHSVRPVTPSAQCQTCHSIVLDLSQHSVRPVTAQCSLVSPPARHSLCLSEFTWLFPVLPTDRPYIGPRRARKYLMPHPDFWRSTPKKVLKKGPKGPEDEQFLEVSND